jgi:hypothetical protein
MPSSGILRRVALVRTDDSKEVPHSSSGCISSQRASITFLAHRFLSH